MYAVARLQSHSVITTLRSTPCGLEGCAEGTAPAAMRSLHSAKCLSAGATSMREIAFIMFVIACPDARRRIRASVEAMCAKSFGIVRVALLPIWWHVTQPLVFTMFSHSACVFTFERAPVPNSEGSGIFSIEYQYAAG